MLLKGGGVTEGSPQGRPKANRCSEPLRSTPERGYFLVIFSSSAMKAAGPPAV